ncbi:helix-turn-helix domain-containing protein [Streptomyces atratus]|uniref:Transcriptional regulator n=1 Tax=Streptomyces atratus TaxID=1893 RepID=A0A2Z5JEG3_STRAR|nr:helix-turn-helix transcriptional regulator [Streptomyces atratus]AXE78737.1 transcriptional regulator [Streptomyces atratus]
MARAENKETASPTARLVAEVARTLRMKRGWTQEQLGDELGYSAAAVSAMETCAQPASDEMLVTLERVLGDGTGFFDTARKYIRMEKYPDEFKDYVPLEQTAARIELYAMDFIHGLFQTEAYARALIGGGYPPLPDARVEELVEARMARKALFDREPMTLIELVLEESVLTRVFGNKQVMREQMQYLAECDRRRNVTLQVLLSDPGPEGEYAGGHGSLNVLESPNHQHFAYVEVQEESWLVSDPAKVSRYAQRCAKIRAQALGPRESLDLIERLAGVEE